MKSMTGKKNKGRDNGRRKNDEKNKQEIKETR